MRSGCTLRSITTVPDAAIGDTSFAGALVLGLPSREELNSNSRGVRPRPRDSSRLPEYEWRSLSLEMRSADRSRLRSLRSQCESRSRSARSLWEGSQCESRSLSRVRSERSGLSPRSRFRSLYKKTNPQRNKSQTQKSKSIDHTQISQGEGWARSGEKQIYLHRLHHKNQEAKSIR